MTHYCLHCCMPTEAALLTDMTMGNGDLNLVQEVHESQRADAANSLVYEANLRLLLDQLADVPDAHRAAAFVCCAVLALPDGRTLARHGRFEGSLTRAPRGSNGFGYDPIFEVAGTGRTFAEMPLAEKKQHGHRGKAFSLLEPKLRQLLEAS